MHRLQRLTKPGTSPPNQKAKGSAGSSACNQLLYYLEGHQLILHCFYAPTNWTTISTLKIKISDFYLPWYFEFLEHPSITYELRTTHPQFHLLKVKLENNLHDENRINPLSARERYSLYRTIQRARNRIKTNHVRRSVRSLPSFQVPLPYHPVLSRHVYP